MNLNLASHKFVEDFKKAISWKDWADKWGREMGIGGVTTNGGRWTAGNDDDLDAFRHAFISALLKAWDELRLMGNSRIADAQASILGELNEIINSPEDAKCSRFMDSYNNEVGRSLAPSAATMLRWIFAGVNPSEEIAKIIAKAVKDGRLIKGFNDPRMEPECQKKAKIKGEYYVWRTVEDDQVRWSHSVKNGRVFRWDGPEGLPGEEYGCRCWAEPVDPKHDAEPDKVFKK